MSPTVSRDEIEMDREEQSTGTGTVTDTTPEQPAFGQGDLCLDCRFRLPGQMCGLDRDSPGFPDLRRFDDGTEWCGLFEDLREGSC